jgi:hypothetical protein
MSVSLNVPAISVVGQQMTVVEVVYNNGSSALTTVQPGSMVAGGQVTYVSGPAPASDPTLAIGATINFTWVYTVSAAGTATFQDNATSAQYTSPLTAIYNSSLLAPTVTPTPPVVTPTPGNVLEIPTETPVIAFPNPWNSFMNPGITVMRIQFAITKPVESIMFKLYTASTRLVRQVEVKGHLDQGLQTIQIPGSLFDGLAEGGYFYVIIAADKDGITARSSINKIIILK